MKRGLLVALATMMLTACSTNPTALIRASANTATLLSLRETDSNVQDGQQIVSIATHIVTMADDLLDSLHREEDRRSC